MVTRHAPTHRSEITDWQTFATAVRSKGCHLLQRLDDFPDAVLISGCQRSGTTMLSRIITQSQGMVNYWSGGDDELDAALILCGRVRPAPHGRYCFQTTYLNDCYPEYFQRVSDQRIIWLLRNPCSVVYSMLYNWKRYALDELFAACGAPLLNGLEKWLYILLGPRIVNPLRRACLAYAGKTSQIFALANRFDHGQLMMVDYETLVQEKESILPQIYDFIDLPYKPEYAGKIHAQSLDKARQLSSKESSIVRKICQPTYLQAKELIAPAKKYEPS